MTNHSPMWLPAVAGFLMATPALAQAAPAPPLGEPGARIYRFEKRGPDFQAMSPEGRRIMAEAMRGSREDRAAVIAARDRINELAAADRLDIAALRRAMEAERRLVDAQHARRQAALLEAFQKLSTADRKAFAERAREGRQMAEGRAAEWRRWAEQFRERLRDMPVPPAPPPVPE